MSNGENGGTTVIEQQLKKITCKNDKGLESNIKNNKLFLKFYLMLLFMLFNKIKLKSLVNAKGRPVFQGREERVVPTLSGLEPLALTSGWPKSQPP